jgi:hypothetical protein
MEESMIGAGIAADGRMSIAPDATSLRASIYLFISKSAQRTVVAAGGPKSIGSDQLVRFAGCRPSIGRQIIDGYCLRRPIGYLQIT